MLPVRLTLKVELPRTVVELVLTKDVPAKGIGAATEAPGVVLRVQLPEVEVLVELVLVVVS